MIKKVYDLTKEPEITMTVSALQTLLEDVYHHGVAETLKQSLLHAQENGITRLSDFRNEMQLAQLDEMSHRLMSEARNASKH